jgi:hypothetical protein
MPRDRVVLTREPESRPAQQAEYNRAYRRGLTIVAVGALFDVAAVVLVLLENWAAAIAVGIVGILIALVAARELVRAGRALESRGRR